MSSSLIYQTKGGTENKQAIMDFIFYEFKLTWIALQDKIKNGHGKLVARMPFFWKMQILLWKS
jgi:hypothetical protein